MSRSDAGADDGGRVRKRKSVTISETPERFDELGERRPANGKVSMPLRSALKKEDVTLVIRSADPIGKDTAVYEFTKYQMPIIGGGKGAIGGIKDLERVLATYFGKISILLGRSSGRDKAASVIQYLAMFWGSQPFVNLSGIEDTAEAPWKKLEESMSSGRKVFRLLKWIKEYEKARLAVTAPDSYLGLGHNKRLALFQRVLAVLMNSFSFLYYWFDNMVWAAQANLVNRSPQELTRKQLFSAAVSYEQYLQIHSKHKASIDKRIAANERVLLWKEYKNWSSLGRLVFAIVYSVIQISTLKQETRRLIIRYAERIAKAKGAERAAEVGSSPDQRIVSRHLRYDSSVESVEDLKVKSVPVLENEREARLQEIYLAISEQHEDLLMSFSHLGILLSRLGFPGFKELPQWMIGILGVIAGWIGCIKNWPRFVPKPKAKVQKQSSSDGA
mmetsp:Transcript_6873/g.10872  ORF Transcript_6873/g.10872 Transcript_6873/m.10872 type:complete len:445 (-) Transcript_6873:248-1582(-)